MYIRLCWLSGGNAPTLSFFNCASLCTSDCTSEAIADVCLIAMTLPTVEAEMFHYQDHKLIISLS